MQPDWAQYRNTYWDDTKKNVETELCDVCHGCGYSKYTVDVPCVTCGSSGKVDFVSKVTGTPTKIYSDRSSRIAIETIHRLIAVIRELAYKYLDKDIIVDIKEHQYNQYKGNMFK